MAQYCSNSLFIGVVAGVVFSLIFARFALKQFPLSKGPKSSSGVPHFRIATASRPHMNFPVQALEGFKQELAKRSHKFTVEIDDFFADNQLTMQAMLNEAVDAGYDLILPIGAAFTQLAHSIATRRKSKIPVVFAGVLSPASSLGVMKNDAHPDGNITGVSFDNIPSDTLVEAIMSLKPHMKRVLLPWSTSGNGGRMGEQIKKARPILEKKGIIIEEVVIESVGEVVKKIQPFMKRIDSMIIFPGSLISEAVVGLIKLCDQHNVTLATFELGSVSKGAAIGWGGYSEEIGAAAVDFVEKILLDGASPQQLPVKCMDDWVRLAVNMEAMDKQDLQLTTAQLFCLRSGMLIQKTVR